MVTLQGNQNSLYCNVLFVSFLLSFIFVAHVTEALGTFGFDIHHRYSDTVKKILGNEGLPEKDTIEYFSALAHRDHLRGRRLAGATDQLTFASGNSTLRSSELGFLQYAYVKVGTPGQSFLVALDSGTDLFWVPCECDDCPRNLKLGSGDVLDFNIYQGNATSTVEIVSCKSTICGSGYSCTKDESFCAYQTEYIYPNTSTTGFLLQDVLQLRTNENPSTSLNSNITFGCGVIQTGEFLNTTAMNGLLGLGMGDLSVPSILAEQGLIANSFSFCSGPDAVGRIVFGDVGSLDQSETPFSISPSQPSYIVSIEELTIGTKVSASTFTALLDTGFAFTQLTDPVYTTLTKTFDSQVLDPKITITNLPFEYCYELSSSSSGPVDPKSPNLAFTMGGGSQFDITRPNLFFTLKRGGYAYCLAVLKGATNIIGLKFMIGQKMVFNRETNVLGWKTSDCYGNDEGSNGSPPSPTTSNVPPPISSPTPPPPRTPFSTPSPPPPSRFSSSPPPPRSGATPEPTEASPPPPGSSSQNPGFRVPGDAARLNSFTCTVVMAFLSFISHYFIFHH